VSLERNRAAADQPDVAVLPRREVRQPRRFGVILHNDDYTTMEFVVMVLNRFFGKSDTEATRTMLEVHHRGQGLAGVYSRDVAESKVEQVEELARSEGHPLRCTAEPFEGETDDQPGS
jgi:ATP-dependent Clp protease adaptor protein ClpS